MAGTDPEPLDDRVQRHPVWALSARETAVAAGMFLSVIPGRREGTHGQRTTTVPVRGDRRGAHHPGATAGCGSPGRGARLLNPAAARPLRARAVRRGILLKVGVYGWSESTSGWWSQLVTAGALARDLPETALRATSPRLTPRPSTVPLTCANVWPREVLQGVVNHRRIDGKDGIVDSIAPGH